MRIHDFSGMNRGMVLELLIIIGLMATDMIESGSTLMEISLDSIMYDLIFFS